MSEDQLMVVLVTCPTQDTARKISKSLVEEKLCACAQISGPIESHYFWKDKMHADQEFRLVLKTHENLWSKVSTRIRELHPDETPQIMSTPVTQASRDYADWLRAQTLS